MRKNNQTLLVVVLLALAFFSCKKDAGDAAPTVPSLTTAAATSITYNSVISGGNISSTGGKDITDRGVCWSTSHNPVFSGTHSTDGSGIGAFASNVTGLLPSTTYYIRAYATNSVGTAYGNEITVTTSVSPLSSNIYVAGFEKSTAKKIAKIWNNGTAISLTNGTNDAEAQSIVVSGSDVYAAGYESNGTVTVATVWKNGTATQLSDGTKNATALSMAVSGTDVYVVGYESNGTVDVAKLWKNGVASSLTNGSSDAQARAVCISGADVYIMYVEKYGFFNSIKIWKNGSVTAITNGSVQTEGRGLYVSGSDVYVSGYEGSNSNPYSKAKIWKNGVGTSLTTSLYLPWADAKSVFVSGTDVYAAGFILPATGPGIMTGKMWKNGVETTLPGDGDVYASAIAVSGTDVYVVGNDHNVSGENKSVIVWKNAVSILLTDGSTEARPWSIFIK